MMYRHQCDMQHKMSNPIRNEMGARGARFRLISAAGFSGRRIRAVLPGLCAVIIAQLLMPPGDASAQDFDRRERSFDVLHYDIRVRLDESTKTVHGDVRITLRGLRASHPPHDEWNGDVVLDAVNMSITDVSWNPGRGIDADAGILPRVSSISAPSISAPSLSAGMREGAWAYDSTRLAVQFRGARHPLSPSDTVTVRVRYSCSPQKGLYFIQPDASYPDDPRQIWTQGQGEDNRHWIPSYDYPNDKATSETRVTVDTALQCVSNGRLVARRGNGDGTITWHWSLAHPHSSYLIMIAAGRYGVFEEQWDAIPVRSYHYHSDNPDDVRRTFEDTDAMVAYFSDFLGVRYPWSKYAQIPVAHFLYGGMENTTATIMADTRLVVDARAALDYDPQPLIAHELAHQWVGDYVTYIDWRNEWLNEGFATFLQQMWTRERFGEEDFRLQRFSGIRSYMDWTDGAGRLPVVHRERTSAANTYSKGAAVLHMLMDLIGERDFRRVMQAWLRRHAFGSVETNDFKRTIEDVTGRPLQWFFDQWLYKAGYPEIEITREPIGEGRTRVVFRQVQEIDSLCGYFRIPLETWVPPHSAGEDVRVHTTWIDGASSADTIDLSGHGNMLLFDPERRICGRVHVDYSAEERAELLRLASNTEMSSAKGEDAGAGTVVPAPWRVLLAERIVEDEEAMRDGDIRGVLFDAAAADPVPAVRKAAATKLAERRPVQIAWADDLREILLRLREDAASGVRATALNGLNNFRDPALIPIFRSMLSDSSYYVEASAMNGLLALDSTGSIGVVRERLLSDSYGDVLALAALDWVRRYRLVDLQDIVINLAGPGHGPALRAKAFETLLALRTAPAVLRKIILNMLGEPRPEFRIYAISALQMFGREEARDLMRSRLAGEDNPRVRAHMKKLFQL